MLLLCQRVIVFCAISSIFGVNSELEYKYHQNDELEGVLRKFLVQGAAKLRTKLYSIGNSSDAVQPFPLWVLELTAAPKNQVGLPNVKLLGNLHGNEAGGREILLHFIDHLISGYGKNENVTWLLDNTRIHILPTINPDGFKVASNTCRGTAGRGVPFKDTDLNRNFPVFPNHEQEKPERDSKIIKKWMKTHYGNAINQVKEAKAVMEWMKKKKFILSAALHEGALVANYPYDIANPRKNPNSPNTHLTPDNDVFEHLARTYADKHPTMQTEHCTTVNKEFVDGITNGANWYSFDGAMGDYNYDFHGCMELTLELSCCKYPNPRDLPKLWNQNKESLMLYCMQANRGVTGRILDRETGEPVEAMLKIVGRDIYFSNLKETGEFWRILLPGEYVLQVESEGYYAENRSFVVEDFEKFPKLTKLTVFLLNSSVPTTTTTSTTISTTATTEATPKAVIPNISSRNFDTVYEIIEAVKFGDSTVIVFDNRLFLFVIFFFVLLS